MTTVVQKAQNSGQVKEFYNVKKKKKQFFKKTKEIKKNYVITEIWSIIYDKGDHHTSHNHGSMGLTGILYLNLPNYEHKPL